MKKWIGLYLLVFLAACMLVAYVLIDRPAPSVVVQILTTQELSPEVEKALTIQVPEHQEMMKNTYVGLMGMRTPEGEDYMAAGAQMILDTIKVAQEELNPAYKEPWTKALPKEGSDKGAQNEKKPFKMVLDENDVVFEILDASKNRTDYIQNILKNKALILEKIRINKAFIQRYFDIFTLPNYNGEVYSTLYEIPNYGDMIAIGDLHFARAVIAFEEGDSDLGFELMKKELDIVKRMFGSRSHLIDQMVAVRRFHYHLSVIDFLMDEPFFNPYLGDKRLANLLRSFTSEEEKGLAQSLRNNFDSDLRILSMFHDQALAESQHIVLNLTDRREHPIKMIRSLSASYVIDSDTFYERNGIADAELMYDRNATLNTIYTVSSLWVDRVTLSSQEISKLYASGEALSLEDEARNLINSLQEQWKREQGENTFMVGYEYVFSFFTSEERNIQRYYDVQTYLRLIQVKYALLRSQTSQEQVPALLNQLGQKGAHPITQKEFIWDSDNKTLSTPCLDKELKRICNGQDEMSVRVKLIG